MAAAAELAVLDGRYQVLRRLGGPPNAPLMLASDLRRGEVVCLRLRRFTTAMAHLAAVPRLAARPDGDDGPLLPFDFGVDGDVAYLVRPYAPAVSLEARLDGAAPLPPLEALRIVTGAGRALLDAAAQGFAHPGLQARHVLITPAGRVRVAGFDSLSPQPAAGFADGRALALLLRAALTGHPGADLPAPLRRLLVILATWERRDFPSLDAVVDELARAEARLSGNTRKAVAFRASARALRGARRRLRRLGPLLRTYLVIGGLLAGTAALSAAALSAHGGTNRILVYAVAPAPAAVDAPPRPIAIATAAPRAPSTTTTAATESAAIVAALAPEQSVATAERASAATTAPRPAVAGIAEAVGASRVADAAGSAAPAAGEGASPSARIDRSRTTDTPAPIRGDRSQRRAAGRQPINAAVRAATSVRATTTAAATTTAMATSVTTSAFSSKETATSTVTTMGSQASGAATASRAATPTAVSSAATRDATAPSTTVRTAPVTTSATASASPTRVTTAATTRASTATSTRAVGR